MLLTDSVRQIKNIGEKRVEQLAKLGIFTVLDLIEYIPRDYDDRSDVKTISELAPDEVHTFKATTGRAETMGVGGKTVTKIKLKDATGEIDAVWFNQPYIKHNFKQGSEYIFTGRVQLKYGRPQIEVSDYEITDKELLSNGIIVPIYPSTYKLSQKTLRSIIKDTLHQISHLVEDYLPDTIKQQYTLCDKRFALHNIHFPESNDSFFVARRRLVFEEFFLLQLTLFRMKGDIKSKKDGVPFAPVSVTPLQDMFAYTLTRAQATVLDELMTDLQSGYVTNRLIQGDVGSGKTAVAMLAAYVAIQNGYQAVLMAPTDVLAVQHFHSFVPYFEKLSLHVVVLTGSLKQKEKRQVCAQIANGEAQMIIGTHAVIQTAVEYHKLGLVITDEQHRFGVRQRAMLREKGTNPHVVVMTATPIPRTLGLILYGDLDISIIDELPPGRQKIDTSAVTSAYHERIYTFIKSQLDSGRQAYIICPQIEDDEEEGAKKAVLSYTAYLSEQALAGYTVDCVHGKMKNDAKQDIMTRFSEGHIQVLVATTVIEVGINVPNATIMLIENADRFGLAQLHQLRGRVGRGADKSYCILVSDAKSKISKDRLKVMTQSGDGFYISEKDLALRGPGDFFGTRQHGLPELKIANLYRDMDILKEAQKAAEQFTTASLGTFVFPPSWQRNEFFTI